MSVPVGRGFRVAVVGGNFGAKVLLPAFRAAGADVIAIAASTRVSADLLAAQHNVAHACSSIEEVLDMRPDAIGLAVPPVECQHMLPRLLDARIPLFVEKPLGISGDIATKLADRAAGLTTAVDFEFGELRTFRALKRIVDEGILGAPRFGQVTWLTRSLAQTRRHWTWKTDARRGGGAISMFGSQVLYLFEVIFGNIERVSATIDASATAAFAPPGEMPADDRLQAFVGFRSGLNFSILVSLVSPSQPFQRWEVEFERGFVTIDNIGAPEMMGFKLVAVDEAGRTLRSEADPVLPDGDSRIAAVTSLATRFLVAMREQVPVEPDLRTGARIQSLVGTLNHAAHTGCCEIVNGPSHL